MSDAGHGAEEGEEAVAEEYSAVPSEEQMRRQVGFRQGCQSGTPKALSGGLCKLQGVTALLGQQGTCRALAVSAAAAVGVYWLPFLS